MQPGARVVEHFFRHESGRLMATLLRVLGPHQGALAEDIVQQTLLEALARWSYGPLPDNPAAWLTRVARNRALDALRRTGTHHRLEGALVAVLDHAPEPGTPRFEAEVADDTLRLMFVCCAPSLSARSHVALILKWVCGFSVDEIAAALLASPVAVERRLSRAKAQLEASGAVEATGEALLERRTSVQGALYSLFSEGFHGSHPEHATRVALCAEALRLTRVLATHPWLADPSSDALWALMCLHAARLPARVGADGDLIGLRYQDRSLWDPALLAEGMSHLKASARGSNLGRWHLEAGLAATHAVAPTFAETDWHGLVAIYDALRAQVPSPIVDLNRAIALGWRDGPRAGLDALAAVEASALQGYPFLAAARGELLAELHDPTGAAAAFEEAIRLARNPVERAFFEGRLAAVAGGEDG